MMRRKSHFPIRRSGRNRFTLIELLVVITIVMVLAALLLPALRKAKEMAMGATCRSNMRQISIGFIGYSGDNEGYHPPMSVQYTSYTWKGQTRSYAGGIYLWWYSAILAGPYFGNDTIACSNFAPSEQGFTNSGLACPYWRNRSATGVGLAYNGSANPAVKFTGYLNYMDGVTSAGTYQPAAKANNPGKLVTLVDSGLQGWVKLEYITNTPSQVGYNHNLATNVAFLDGHVDATRNLLSDYYDGTSDLSMK